MSSHNKRKADIEGYVYIPKSIAEDTWFALGILEYMLYGESRRLKEVPAFNAQREYFDCCYSILEATRSFYNGRDYGKLLYKHSENRKPHFRT